jgi:hypothetical protein
MVWRDIQFRVQFVAFLLSGGSRKAEGQNDIIGRGCTFSGFTPSIHPDSPLENYIRVF